MTREQAIRKREKLAAKLSSPSGVLRGSLLQRTIHHSTGCLKSCSWRRHIRSGCSRWVIPAEKLASVSVRPEQVPLVRKAIEEYRDVKQALECNQRTESSSCSGWIARKPRRTGTPVVIAAHRRLQREISPNGFIAETVEDLWEPWMRHADKALEDDTLLLVIQEELGQTLQEEAKTRGRKAIAR